MCGSVARALGWESGHSIPTLALWLTGHVSLDNLVHVPGLKSFSIPKGRGLN